MSSEIIHYSERLFGILAFPEKDLPQFLDLKDGKPVLDAYVDQKENSLVIPCRTANYNATVLGIYLVLLTFHFFLMMRGQAPL